MRSPLQRLRRLLAPLIDLETLWLVEGTATPAAPLPESASTRRASDDDWPAVAALVGERTVRNGIRRNDTCVVADDGRVIGCAWLSTSKQRIAKYNVRGDPEPGEAYVYGVFVDSTARRKGAAYSMLRDLRAGAAQEGISSVLAHISPRNPITPHLFIDRLGDRVREQTRVLVLARRIGVPLWTSRRTEPERARADARPVGRGG